MDDERQKWAVEATREWLETLSIYDNARSDKERRGWARVCLAQGASLIADICGPEMVADAYGRIEDSKDRARALVVAAARLNTASDLFGANDRPDRPGSLSSIALEALAIEKGDDPSLFAALDGRRVNVAAARTKLRALEWDSYLERRGETASHRHGAIGSAFGAEWDTISRWSKSLADIFGSELVNDATRQASTLADSRLRFPGMDRWETWTRALENDGKRYKEALGFHVPG